MLKRSLGGLLLALWLSGCAMQPAPAPSLAALPVAPAQTLQLRFEHAGETHLMIGVLRRDTDSLRLALLSPQGQRLLSWQRDASGAHMESAVWQPPFDAEWLGSRLAWSLWPAEALHQAFAGSRWTLQGSPQQRAIYYRKQLIAKVKMDGHCRLIDDLDAGYQLTITVADAARNTTPCPSF
ncbi:DUF3261 domain-containing protein [Halopseudomonas sabulinigri]|uniref:DUF3261 domain-containing protein n=1 Tax=Halopseudomonas sabulinigri TaxID=472181 RepID=A0ABP9ZU89_9GAMM